MAGERPPVSLSMALKCRAHIWLAAHGHEQEPVTPTSQRVFDMGHLIEAAMFDGITLGEDKIGPWFYTLGEIRDPIRGVSLNPEEWEITDRQTEVEYAGFKGHVDGLLRHKQDKTVILPDVKSASGFSFDRALKEDLTENPFSRYYVGQLHAYRRGLIDKGIEVTAMILLYLNKEQGKVMFRHVDHQPEIDQEIAERLAWAKSTAEPTPDYEWKSGAKLPLACSYCSFKTSCATLRGMTLEQAYEKNKPIWVPAAKVA